MKDKSSIDELISNLTDDLKPVKCMPHPLRIIGPWVVLSILYGIFCIYFLGIRHDFNELHEKPIFMFEMLLMSFIGISSAITSAYLSIPDMRGQSGLIAATLTASGIFVLWASIRGFTEGVEWPHIHMDHCMGEGAFMAIVPVTILVFLLKRGATTRPIMMGLMNVLSVSALGYIVLRMTCSMDTITHSTISHLLPYVLLGAVVGTIARRLYKW